MFLDLLFCFSTGKRRRREGLCPWLGAPCLPWRQQTPPSPSLALVHSTLGEWVVLWCQASLNMSTEEFQQCVCPPLLVEKECVIPEVVPFELNGEGQPEPSHVAPAVVFILSAFFFTSALVVTSFLLREMKIAERLQKQNSFTLAEFVAYRVDYYFSMSILAKPIALCFATIFLVTIGGFLYSVVSIKPFMSSLWQSWSFIADPG